MNKAQDMKLKSASRTDSTLRSLSRVSRVVCWWKWTGEGDIVELERHHTNFNDLAVVVSAETTYIPFIRCHRPFIDRASMGVAPQYRASRTLEALHIGTSWVSGPPQPEGRGCWTDFRE